MTTEGRGLHVEQAVSAGGVVYRHGGRGIEILLCGRTPEGLWALPKGTPERGESLHETALREVSEETGLGVDIQQDLGTIQYQFARPQQGVRFEKTVHHFLMRPSGAGSVAQHDGEYDRVEWFPAEEALRIMTHRNEMLVVRRALAALGAETA
ncbi:MAG TPA: NUDIX hydrolase [Dehalococcoidia bacterium]|nr:NUDIX hydrolase [Dehalococcoidia bacterium]